MKNVLTEKEFRIWPLEAGPEATFLQLLRYAEQNGLNTLDCYFSQQYFSYFRSMIGYSFMGHTIYPAPNYNGFKL
jgi:hypothetical protein